MIKLQDPLIIRLSLLSRILMIQSLYKMLMQKKLLYCQLWMDLSGNSVEHMEQVWEEAKENTIDV